MHILLLRHYPLSEGPSMRAFAEQIAAGLRNRGHTVQECTAPVRLARLAGRYQPVAKWLGYLDQFVLFPLLLRWRARSLPAGIICVFADQALGPWIPLLKQRPHLVHVHDLLALEAAQHRQPFLQLGWTGRLYQHWIRRGFRQARCFASVSQATRMALVQQLQRRPLLSEVLYNPLQTHFRPLPAGEAAAAVESALPALAGHPFLFHIGRNWYKNRLGLLAIWEQLQGLPEPPHLVLVGSPDREMEQWLQQRPQLLSRLHMVDRASDEFVLALYGQAAALLFPSHAEGFGWPILEALACGCPVITTDRSPMSEVGGDAATYIPPSPTEPQAQEAWARLASQQVLSVLLRSPAEREVVRQRGYAQASHFQLEHWLDQLEDLYQQALALQGQG